LAAGLFNLGGTASTPRLAVREKRIQQLPKVDHGGPILMTQNCVASYE
jgi:hypothetical protein